MAKIVNRALQVAGEPRVVGTPAITVLDYDSNGKVYNAKGASVPTDGDVGYATGCVFIDTDGGVGTTLYVNEGSATSADFNLAAGEGASGANTTLSNLGATAINAALISDTNNTDDLGSATKGWKDLYISGVVYADTISEDGAGAGVTIDSVLLKDGQVDLADDKKVLLGTGDDGELYVNSDNLTIANVTQDKDIIFSFDDGGVTATITIDASEAGQLKHSLGTFDFSDDHITTSGNISTTGSGTLAVAGTSVLTGNVTMSGDLAIVGSLTFGGNWTVAATLTVDELILDTDGVAPAGTNCYAVRDNTGDLTVNAITGKEFHVAINNTDEYDFSATVLDMNANALDNCGFLILNAASAPANTEVYAVNDNTGDLTLNAVSGKTINFAIAGSDEISIAANLLQITAGSDIKFMDDGAILDSNGNEVITVEAVGSATTYLNIKNANGAAIELECMGAADKGFLFKNDQNETILELLPIASADTYIQINSASGGQPILKVIGTADTGIEMQNAAGEVMFECVSTTAPLNWLSMSNADTGNPVIFLNAGEDDIGMSFQAKNAEEMLVLAAIAAGTNNIKITNNANGSGPTLETEGSADANVQLNILTKGDLGVNIKAGTAGDAARPALIFEDDANTGIYGDGSDILGISTGGVARCEFSVTGAKFGGTADHAGTAGTNTVSIFNGTPPVGALANGASFYSAGGEMTAIDATGNTTVLSPHDSEGNFIIHSYSKAKSKTLVVELERLINAFVELHPELKQYVRYEEGRKEAGQVGL